MEVILLEKIDSLGQMGDVVSVKNGYARNYLMPQKKALRADHWNVKLFEERRAQLEADNRERKAKAEEISLILKDMVFVLVRAASDTGHLYGSVSARDISDAITDAGIKINRNQVKLDKALKELGVELVRINLHPEVRVNVTVNIARSRDEAVIQLQVHKAKL
ncbi:ribosomal protein L9 [Candidatus Endolissoclinum faulkneri L2]|uniref:Large ribosomal subunit protein bL9 n=1 Tax=Candidatus Endolissoclinum faulkneri L2 TaxID=1193729 RepID=K7YM23_9PROT|nr:50S ribosomal protein L9 [Candidatus Endolissoclinum faulkneri]AFX98542.1 ribosomal protein L9 [Candidatus Endolissoclinum faulkneri L2]